MSSTQDPAAPAPKPDAKPKDARRFWPPDRIETVRRMALDKTMPDDAFERSKMLQWMREFCIEAPTWLETDASHERLRVKAEAALGSCRAAAAQVQAVLADLESMLAPPAPQLDRWAEQVARVPRETMDAQLPPRPAPRPPMRQVHLEEAIAEADARAKDAPKGPAKTPAAGEKLPGEKAWDLAHGKPPGGKSQIDLKKELERLERNDRDFARRIVGKAAAPQAAPPSAPAPKLPPKPKPIITAKDKPALTSGYPARRNDLARRAAIDAAREKAQATAESKAEEAARRGPGRPRVAPVQKLRNSIAGVGSRDWARQREGDRNPILAQYERELIRGKKLVGVKRAGYRLALNTLKLLHGEEVARFAAHDILCDVVNTTALCLVVARFMGTFPNRTAAQESCAQHYGREAIEGLRQNVDPLRRYADGLTLEHEDGRCSWFRA